VLPGFLRLNGRHRNHFARASGPAEAGLRAGPAGVRGSIARSARRRRLKPPGPRDPEPPAPTAPPSHLPWGPAPWCRRRGVSPAVGYGLAVSGCTDQLRGLYRIVKVSWPLLYFLAFSADFGQMGHRSGRPAGGAAGRPDRRARARRYGGAPNIEPGTRDDGLLLRAGAGLETSRHAAKPPAG
jgi:hypothetical protein